nr:hypothetical protein [Tanacetum cinerariifolium]
MVVILEKSKHNVDFHPIVDFVEASPLRYAFTFKPTIYVSHIRQFWSTARIETTEEGTQILTTVDRVLRTVTESSLRRNIKLQDMEGISSLPDTKLFENLTLMGYNISPNQKFTFQKDEPAFPVRDDSQGEDCPTDSGFIVDQDRATIAKSFTLPHDSAPRVTSHAAEEGKEMATVLTSMDAATVLASRVVNVSTGSGSIPTASTPAEGLVPTSSEEVPIASPVFATATVVTPVTRRKGKEKEDQRRAKQIARDAEIAKIYAEEELQSMIDGLDSNNKTVAKHLEEYHYQQRKSWTKKQKRDYYMAVIRNNLGWKVKDFRGITFEEVEAKFNSVCKQIEDFISMGSKEEAEKIKRKGINLEQESAKNQKSSEEITEEAKSPEEVPEEKVKKMMNLVPIEEVYLEVLQVKHPIIDWKVHSEGHTNYRKITRLGGSSACYQFFIDLLKHLDREDLNQLWRLVKETLSTRPPATKRQRNLYACGEGLPSEEGSSTCDDLLQTSSGELLTNGK